ncbi:hypothetical protein [Ferrimonas kyonanensis]|uniref:hypothetical protein n=1 Tax=Ferrimonas kyonanensis TaxID=364763 RepID=UPI000480D22B|nr:hypothetical protein [Ferrimonas kyonanensis]
MSIKLKVLWALLLVGLMSGCNDQTSDAASHFDYCVSNWGVNDDKALLMKSALSSEDDIDSYVALKQGSTSHYTYSLIMVAHNQSESFAVVMTNSMKEPVRVNIDSSLMGELLNQGRLLSEGTTTDSAMAESGNTSCYAFQIKSNDKVSAKSYIGALSSDSAINLLSRLDALTVEIESQNVQQLDLEGVSPLTLKGGNKKNLIWELDGIK